MAGCRFHRQGAGSLEKVAIRLNDLPAGFVSKVMTSGTLVKTEAIGFYNSSVAMFAEGRQARRAEVGQRQVLDARHRLFVPEIGVGLKLYRSRGPVTVGFSRRKPDFQGEGVGITGFWIQF
jgi:hypothetical protein